jgi:hypothetical protein
LITRGPLFAFELFGTDGQALGDQPCERKTFGSPASSEPDAPRLNSCQRNWSQTIAPGAVGRRKHSIKVENGTIKRLADSFSLVHHVTGCHGSNFSSRFFRHFWRFEFCG